MLRDKYIVPLDVFSNLYKGWINSKAENTLHKQPFKTAHDINFYTQDGLRLGYKISLYACYFTCAHTIAIGIVITWVVCDIRHCGWFAHWRWSTPWLFIYPYWLNGSIECCISAITWLSNCSESRTGLNWRIKVYFSAKFKEPLSQLNAFTTTAGHQIHCCCFKWVQQR